MSSIVKSVTSYSKFVLFYIGQTILLAVFLTIRRIQASHVELWHKTEKKKGEWRKWREKKTLKSSVCLGWFSPRRLTITSFFFCLVLRIDELFSILLQFRNTDFKSTSNQSLKKSQWFQKWYFFLSKQVLWCM